MRIEKLKNFIEFITYLTMNNYYGRITVKFEDGSISIAEKIDKIKFDNKSYKEYKSSNKYSNK
jgi:hypothetical protein